MRKKLKQGLSFTLVLIIIFALFPEDVFANEAGVFNFTPIQSINERVRTGGATIPGDTNGNGMVNAEDLSFVLRNIGRPVTDENRTADINEDGLINAEDLSIVLRNFGRVAETPSGVGEIYYEYRSDVTLVNEPPVYSVIETDDTFTIHIPVANDEIRELSVGEMFILEPTAENPEGLAGRVTDIRVVGGETIINASMPESLDDIFYEFEFVGDLCLLNDFDNFIIIDVDEMLYWDYGTDYYFDSFGYPQLAPFGYQPIVPHSFRPVVTMTSSYVDVRIQNALWHGINIDGNLKWHFPRLHANITRSNADLFLYTSAEFNLNANASFAFDRIIPLFTIRVIPVPGVRIDIPVGIRLTANGDFELVVRCELEVRFGIRNGQAYARAEFDYSFDFKFNAQATISLNIQARARLLGLPIYGINGDFGRGFRSNNAIMDRCPGSILAPEGRCFVIEAFHVRRINSLTTWGLLRNVQFLRFTLDLARDMERTLWFLHNGRLHRNYCPHGGPTEVQQFDLAYLELDIFAVNVVGVGPNPLTRATHPANGTLNINGATFTSGISTVGTHPAGAGRHETFDISGSEFNRLSGYFGRASGSANGRISMSVRCVGNNKFLGVFYVLSGQEPQRVDLYIPAGTDQIRIYFAAHAGNVWPAFGGAYFVNDPNFHTPAADGRVRLEHDIFATNITGIGLNPLDRTSHPTRGTLDIGGIIHTSGISTINTHPVGAGRHETFDVSGYEFNRLSGYFGRASGSVNGRISMSVRCLGSNAVLGEFEVLAGGMPIRVDVNLPLHTNRVRIYFVAHTSSVWPAFGGAYFTR